MNNKVRLARAELRVTQEQLADHIGVSRQTINALEAGKYIPSTLLALKLARFFGKPVEALFFLTDEDGSDPRTL